MGRMLSCFLALVLVVGMAPAALATEGNPIPYLTRREEGVRLSGTDFESLCKQSTGEKLRWVSISLPQERQGVLWNNYGLSAERKVGVADEYDARDLDYVAFVPAPGFWGTVSIPFRGQGREGGVFSGKLEITVDSYPGDLIYPLNGEGAFTLIGADLDELCRQTTGKGLESIQFQRPTGGKFYQDRGQEDWTLVKPSTTYYPDKEPNLERLSFEAPPLRRGEWVIGFTATATNDRQFDGKIRLWGDDDPSGDINLWGTAGEPLEFGREDMLGRWMDNLAGEGWQSVCFDPIQTDVGTLYYDHQGSRQRRLGGESLTPEEFLEVSFVPAGTGTQRVRLDVTVMDAKNKAQPGTLNIAYQTKQQPKTDFRYTTGAQPVYFQEAAGEARRYTLPDPAAGRLWSDYTIPTKFSGGALKPDGTFEGEPSRVCFVPKAGFSGEAVVYFPGEGETWNKIVITVNQTWIQGVFSDLPEADAVAHGAEFLYRHGVVKGTSATTFGPQETISRADFILLLARAYGFTQPRRAVENFPDIPPEAYYAGAVAAAKEMGVALGDEKGNFLPLAQVTRRGAALLIERILEQMGVEVGQEELALAQPEGALTRGEMAVLLHKLLTAKK